MTAIKSNTRYSLPALVGSVGWAQLSKRHGAGASGATLPHVCVQVNHWSVNPEIISIFSQLWSVLDPGTGSITVAQLLWLLQRLPEPLGAETLAGAKAKMRNMVLFQDEARRVPFRTTLYELMRAAVAVPLPQHLRVVQQHLGRMQLFFERHPVDSNSMARALWGTFDVDYLLLDEDDVLWWSDESSDSEAGGGRGDAGSSDAQGGDGGQAPAAALGAQSESRHQSSTDGEQQESPPGAVAGSLASLWGRVRGARLGQHPNQVQQQGNDTSSLESQLGGLATSLANVRLLCLRGAPQATAHVCTPDNMATLKTVSTDWH